LYSNIASVISAGKSVEGRDLLGLRIAHKENLPIVMVEAGIHAREWITVTTANWLIRQALSANDELLKSYEWHIFPVVNPDGYVYTREVSHVGMHSIAPKNRKRHRRKRQSS